MCAICGIIHLDHQPVETARLVKMRDEMTNRGPEHGGLHVDGPVGLGHRRLRIIDLSPSGNQPMTNETRTVWVVFNGEIYNFRELREELALAGHVFASQADTEVIVHGYEQWGEGVVARLDGMFALAIWDAPREQLLLARDRFGKKPLYYFRRGERVCFASEIKALTHASAQAFTINPEAVDCYFHHLGTTQEHCIYREVTKVKPGHFEVFRRGFHKARLYWAPDFGQQLKLSEAEWIERTDAALRAAVQRRLVSDVPLGAFLSGGVDSSLVVALMSQLTGQPVKTFSIGFDEGDFSELAFARLVAQRYQTDHREIILKPDVLGVLPALVHEYAEPFADSSAVPTYYVSQGARQQVTVALSGDGGDELFGGYDLARAAWYAERYDRWCPGWLRRPLEAAVLGGWGEKSPLLHKLQTLMVHASADPAVRHQYSMGFTAAHKAQLYTDEFRSALGAHSARHVYDSWQPALRGLSLADQHLYMTLVTRLPNDYLVKVDVASMKVALEIRSPFLDTSLSQLSGSMPADIKVRGGKQKYLLKKLAERYLPREVIYRRKRGFALPLTHWLRGDLGTLARRWVLTGELARVGWFNRSYMERLFEEHQGRTVDHTHRLWALLWLELWFRIFVTKNMKPDDRLNDGVE